MRRFPPPILMRASVSGTCATQTIESAQDPRAIVYDMLMENDGRGYVYLPLLNYAEFNFDHIHEMLQSDRTVLERVAWCVND